MTPVLTGTYHPAILVQFSEAISATTVTTDTLFVTDGQGRRLAGGVTYDGTLNRASFTLGEAPGRGVWQPRHNRTWGPHLGFDTTRPRRRVTQPAVWLTARRRRFSCCIARKSPYGTCPLGRVRRRTWASVPRIGCALVSIQRAADGASLNQRLSMRQSLYHMVSSGRAGDRS